ncbi:hypothetical protein [Mycobacterium sp. 48b]|uniref:hypothetical protein n=1 Tax=Mycobacterium sp. 48b TaxID=3400426 RepID=UPI003AAEB9A3
MRYVRFHPDHIDDEPISEDAKEEFRTWYTTAERARRDAVTEYETTGEVPVETQQIWRAHKKWLLRNKFGNKCAYCEKSLTDIPTAAEHWRPKRAITGSRDHPGYFWLAYSWFNLLPSCDMCNSYAGKKNQFPITGERVFRVTLGPGEREQLKSPADAIESASQPGEYYLGPLDLDDREGPLLLHPYIDQDSAAHLDFTPKGRVEPKTTKGRQSMIVFDLHREQLNTLRSATADRLRRSLIVRYVDRVELSNMDKQVALDEAESELIRMIDERTPFSVASLVMLKKIAARERAFLTED